MTTAPPGTVTFFEAFNQLLIASAPPQLINTRGRTLEELNS